MTQDKRQDGRAAHRPAKCDQRCGERGIYHDHAVSVHCSCGRDYPSVQAFSAHAAKPQAPRIVADTIHLHESGKCIARVSAALRDIKPVALCYTCAVDMGVTWIYPRGLPAGLTPCPLYPHEAKTHRAAGHDVRPVGGKV